MGQSPEELKDNIETTRGELGETLDAIGDRVQPGPSDRAPEEPSPCWRDGVA